MHLLVIRHAIAMTREDFVRTGNDDDDQRPLTARGIRRMKRGTRGLRRLVPHLDVLAASPLVRARQTAEIIAPIYDDIAVETVEALRPEASPAELHDWLRARADSDMAAIVGHEPHLGALVTWLLSGRDESFFEPRKGGAALLELPRTNGAASARLRWALTAGQLRALA